MNAPEDIRAEGPSRVWRLVQRRAALRISGNDPEVLPLPDDYSDIEDFYSVMTDRSIRQEIVEDAYPDHYKAMKWYLVTSPSSVRWLLEAWLLTGKTLDDVLSRCGMQDERLAVDVYRRAFFNVTEEQRSSQAWMHANIWVPASMHQTALYYFDYILKLAAVTKADFIDNLVNPGHLSNDAVRWVRQTVEDIRDRSVLLTGNISSKTPPEYRLTSNENTMKVWREDRASEGLAAQDSAALFELMQVVKDKVSILDHDDIQPDRQDFAAEKYTDDEIVGTKKEQHSNEEDKQS